MHKLILFLCPVVALCQFHDIVDLRAAADKGNVQLTWSLELTGGTPPGGASSYLYELERSGDGTFVDVNYASQLFTMNTGNEWRESYTVTGLAAGAWRFRLRVLQKDVNPYPVTDWSNIALAVITESLQTPVLQLHTLSERVPTPTISMSVGGAPEAKYDLFYGRTIIDSEFDAEFVDRSISRALHVVTLAGVFDPGERVYFKVRALYNGQERWSRTETIVYDPDTRFVYVIPHVANAGAHSTSIYVRYPGDTPNLVEFTALVGGGFFGAGTPQTTRTYLGPESKFHIETVELFDAVLHQKPLIVTSEQPLIVEALYRSDIGSISVSVSPAVEKVARSLTVDGLLGGATQHPGVSVANISEQDGYGSCRLIWVSSVTPDFAQHTTTVYGFELRAYRSHVFTLVNAFPELAGVDFIGTLFIEASVPMAAVGSIASDHGSFRTISFVSQSK